jgi:hypothetical protein
MGTIIGFAVGYVLGMRAGPEGYEELRRAWKEIVSSPELRELLSGGLAALGETLRHGRGLLAERLQPAEAPLRAA